MSEMLANHYFHARDFASAYRLYTPALASHPENKAIRRRMIICCIETGAMAEALEHFTWLVEKDVDFIINTDPVDDDCPCPELLQATPVEPVWNGSAEEALRLGMLWLYCDVHHSYQYLNCYLEANPANRELRQLVSLIAKRCDRVINPPATY